MKKVILIAVILAIIGVYFLGKGITGLVIGESCCFPPNCESNENICNEARPDIISPSALDNTLEIILGSIVILGAFVYLLRSFDAKNKL